MATWRNGTSARRTPLLIVPVSYSPERYALLGRTVDLHTPASLSRYFRDDVLREAETLYAAP